MDGVYWKLALKYKSKITFIIQFVKADYSQFEIVLDYASRGILFKKTNYN